MAKKGQLTILITIGVVILILAGIILYLRSTGREAQKAPAERETLQFPTELKPVGLFIQTCLESEAEKTINKTAIQGGRPLAPRHPYEWEGMILSHGYYMGINDLPTLEEMQNEMNAYLQIHIQDCLGGLQNFKDRGMNLQIGQIEPNFKVGTDAVVVELKYPITLVGETGQVLIEKFNAVIPSRLGYLHDAARKMVEQDISGATTFSFVSQFDLSSYLFPASEADLVMLFLSKDSSFYIINTYGNNSNPEIMPIDNIRVSVGQPISFYVNATDPDGDILKFGDDTDLFDINSETGFISFTPSKEEYQIIKITAEDGKKGVDEESFSIDVVSGEK